jgi:hypothetical protein
MDFPAPQNRPGEPSYAFKVQIEGNIIFSEGIVMEV